MGGDGGKEEEGRNSRKFPEGEQRDAKAPAAVAAAVPHNDGGVDDDGVRGGLATAAAAEPPSLS